MELSSVRMKIKDLQNQIDSAENLLHGLYKSMLQNSSKGISGAQISQWFTYIDMEKIYIKKLYEQLDQLKKQEEDLKQQYLIARRETKVLQNLKERRFKRYVFEQDRLNRLYLDEVALRKVIESGR